ncbi:MAG TPA: hypothetical protein VF939_21255 [Puia sp.]
MRTVAFPAIGQEPSVVPDTVVNSIKLADRASTEKVSKSSKATCLMLFLGGFELLTLLPG